MMLPTDYALKRAIDRISTLFDLDQAYPEHQRIMRLHIRVILLELNKSDFGPRPGPPVDPLYGGTGSTTLDGTQNAKKELVRSS